MIYMISFVVQLNPCLYKHTSIVFFHNFVTRNSWRLNFSNVLFLDSCINYCFRTYCPVVSNRYSLKYVKFCSILCSKLADQHMVNVSPAWILYEPCLMKSQKHKIYFQSFTNNIKKKCFISFQLQKSFRHSSIYPLDVV